MLRGISLNKKILFSLSFNLTESHLESKKHFVTLDCFCMTVLREESASIDSRCSALSGQCACSHVANCHDCCDWMPIWSPSSPPFSPDMALSDLCPFPKLKSNLRGTQFGSNEGVIEAANEYLEDQEKDFYLEGICKLEQRWTKCIALNADYI